MDQIKPETIGAIIGGAILTIATGLGWINRRRATNGTNGTHKKKKDSDEYKRIDAAMEIAQDYQDRLERSENRILELETALETSKRDCTAQIQVVRSECDRQIKAVIADYEQRLDKMQKQLDEQTGDHR